MQAIDVLIVGAGPVGLALAIELETAGVHAVVMDQRTEVDPVPKAPRRSPRSAPTRRRTSPC